VVKGIKNLLHPFTIVPITNKKMKGQSWTSLRQETYDGYQIHDIRKKYSNVYNLFEKVLNDCALQHGST